MGFFGMNHKGLSFANGLLSDAMNAGLDPEMEDQAYVQVRCFQVAAELPFGVFRKALGRFDLDDDSSVDEHVNAMVADVLLFKPDGYPHFTGNGVTGPHKHLLERASVNGFEKAVMQRVVD